MALQNLVLHGVPQHVVGATISKRILMVVAFLAIWLAPQALLFMFFREDIWLYIAFFGCVGGLIFMLRYLKAGTRSGATRFVFSESGIDLLPLVHAKPKGDEREKAFIALNGSQEFRLERVSKVWAKLRVVDPAKGSTLLKLGFRCPVAEEEGVRAALAGIQRAGKERAAVASTRSPAYPSPEMNPTRATTTTNDSTA